MNVAPPATPQCGRPCYNRCVHAPDAQPPADARSLVYRRLVLALLFAVASIASLQWWAGSGATTAPQEPPPSRRATVAAVPAMPIGLVEVAGPVYIVAGLDQVPTDATPVVQILADGTAVLRRPQALAVGPGAAASRDGAWVVLPAVGLRYLSPSQRSALLQVLGVLRAERPIASDVVILRGLQPDDAELSRLLSWVL